MSRAGITSQLNGGNGIMEFLRANDASSSSGKPKEPPKKVLFDHSGMPVGPGSGKPATSLGDLTRSQISVKYVDWNKVPDTTKDLLWKAFKEEFQFRDSQRKDQMQKAAMAWRRYKNKLRKKHLKHFRVSLMLFQRNLYLRIGEPFAFTRAVLKLKLLESKTKRIEIILLEEAHIPLVVMVTAGLRGSLKKHMEGDQHELSCGCARTRERVATMHLMMLN